MYRMVGVAFALAMLPSLALHAGPNTRSLLYPPAPRAAKPLSENALRACDYALIDHEMRLEVIDGQTHYTFRWRNLLARPELPLHAEFLFPHQPSLVESLTREPQEAVVYRREGEATDAWIPVIIYDSPFEEPVCRLTIKTKVPKKA